MPKRKKSPKCIPNQCSRDGYVYYNGICEKLDSSEPCKNFKYLIGRTTYLTVKESSFELVCADNDHTFECNGSCCVNSSGVPYCFRREATNAQRRI